MSKDEKHLRAILKKFKLPTEIKYKNGIISYPHNIVIAFVGDIIRKKQKKVTEIIRL